MRTPMQELLDELKIDRVETHSHAVKIYIEALIEYIVDDLVPYEKDQMSKTIEISTQELYYLHGVLDTLPEKPREFLTKLLNQVEVIDAFKNK